MLVSSWYLFLCEVCVQDFCSFYIHFCVLLSSRHSYLIWLQDTCNQNIFSHFVAFTFIILTVHLFQVTFWDSLIILLIRKLQSRKMSYQAQGAVWGRGGIWTLVVCLLSPCSKQLWCINTSTSLWEPLTVYDFAEINRCYLLEFRYS